MIANDRNFGCLSDARPMPCRCPSDTREIGNHGKGAHIFGPFLGGPCPQCLHKSPQITTKAANIYKKYPQISVARPMLERCSADARAMLERHPGDRESR